MTENVKTKKKYEPVKAIQKTGILTPLNQWPLLRIVSIPLPDRYQLKLIVARLIELCLVSSCIAEESANAHNICLV